ncbi:hypothetical protein MUP42_04490 [Candidatus Bathyarchaeota archaeon]|nr:hypothetical protein [Candidatus Bathyarchaeota archaeon]
MLFSGVLHLLLLLKLPEKASVVPLPGLSSFITHIWRILIGILPLGIGFIVGLIIGFVLS